MTCRQRHKVECGQLGSDGPREAELRTKVFQSLIPTISDDDERDRESELTRGPEALDRIHARSVAQKTDHVLVGLSVRHAYCSRQTMPDAGATARVEAIASIDWQMRLHRASTAWCLFNDDAIGRAQICKCLH